MDIIKILNTNYSQKKWVLVGNDYEGLDWVDESDKPTEEELTEFYQ